jgi:hypothetical protein
MIWAFSRGLVSTDRSPPAGSAVRFGFSQRLLTTARETKKKQKEKTKRSCAAGTQDVPSVVPERAGK